MDTGFSSAHSNEVFSLSIKPVHIIQYNEKQIEQINVQLMAMLNTEEEKTMRSSEGFVTFAL